MTIPISRFQIAFGCLLAFCIAARPIALRADPIDVTYTVSGTSGDYTLDFTVTNNLVSWPDQDLYFFGVALSGSDVTGTPGDFNGDLVSTWNNFEYDGLGSDITYNNNWISGNLYPATSESGFEALISDPTIPVTVNWFAWTTDATPDGTDPYTGGENDNQNPGFSPGENVGFEGVASYVPSPTVPDGGSTMALLGVGLTALASLRRKFRKA
jgi:hypothetical protein